MKLKTESEPEKQKTEKEKKKKDKDGTQKKRKKKETGPMHFTANSEPRSLDVLGDLEPSIFNKVCLV